MTEQRAKAEYFHSLHREKTLVLVNAWDAASARLFEAAGAPAIATTSAGMAWSLGYPDGERMTRNDLIDASARICRSVRVPVSVDIERGFGTSAREVADTIRSLIDAGAIGLNIEDGIDRRTSELFPPEVLAERIGTARHLADERAIPLFINARTDVYLLPGDREARFGEALRRARIYEAAGADGIFMPGLDQIDDIRRMAQQLSLPLNIYAGYEGVPDVKALSEAGVKRVSLGCGPLQSVLGLARRIVTETLEEGTYRTMVAGMLSNQEINKLLTGGPRSPELA